MKTIILIIFSFSLIGCTTIPQGISPAAKPLVNDNGETIKYEVLGNTEGSASHFSLFNFIPFGRANIDDAINNAISTLNGDNLINSHYYVTQTFLFIGSSTSINVKGDVIKYTGTLESKQLSTNTIDDNVDTLGNKTHLSNNNYKNNSNNYSTSSSNFFKDVQHKVTLGSAVQGFAFDYTLIKPLNDFFFYSFGIGYKSVREKNTYTYGFGEYNYKSTYTNEFEVIPLTINIGANGKRILEKENIPVIPYASFGLAYLPPNDFDQIGFNLNIGAVYKIPNFYDIGVGLEYHYFESLTGREMGFSNLNLSFVYKP
ncbi:MAG: hypothetical protein IPH62_06800 [Ignavibacteriae bacterium]|nr:hypothetical protein [Ignavibacteriota bacterium]